MKILFFGDTHGSESFHESLRDASKEADLLVCVGDLTIFEQNIDKIIRKLDSFNKKILLINGNHESATTLKELCINSKNIYFIHKNYFIYGDLIFLGYGGGGFSDTDNAFDSFTEKFIKQLKILEQKNNLKYRIILLTHAPPKNTALDYIDYLNSHVGCKNFRKFIEKYRPLIAVSGHIHETFDIEEKLMNTLLFNPGPLGKLIDIDSLNK